jgi:hypothetical protein
MPPPNWKELQHAYGSAEDLPDILAELDPDPTSPVWEDLWSRVCHQYSTYSASAHVLPFLLTSASAWEPQERAMPLALAGSIVCAPETVLAGHEPCVGELRLLAIETLKSSKLTRSDRIYLMQSVLAFEGDRLWGHLLDDLNTGAFYGPCRACHTNLCFVIGPEGFFCTTQDWPRHPETLRSEILPKTLGELERVGQRLYALCIDSGDAVLGEWICHLFGASSCPQCGEALDAEKLVGAISQTAVPKNYSAE